jgi:hypothetical protein
VPLILWYALERAVHVDTSVQFATELMCVDVHTDVRVRLQRHVLPVHASVPIVQRQ